MTMTLKNSPAFERSSRRRIGYPSGDKSETRSPHCTGRKGFARETWPQGFVCLWFRAELSRDAA